MRDYSESESDYDERSIEYKSDSESDDDYGELEEDINDSALLIYLKNKLEEDSKRKSIKRNHIKSGKEKELKHKKKIPRKKKTAPVKKKEEVIEEVKNDKPIDINYVEAKPIEGDPIVPLYN